MLNRVVTLAVWPAVVLASVVAGCAGADSAASTSTTADAPTVPATASTTERAQSASTPSSTSTTITTTTVPPTTTTTVATTTPYVVPVADVAAAGWGTTHAGYTATDIFSGCGAQVVSPVNGEVLQVRTVDRWDPTVDNPAARGGRSVAILGDDGVRYYAAHLDTIAVAQGERVDAGDPIATVGRTGRSSACHVHFAISPPCPGPEWSVRRGVIWPYPYLDAWVAGEQRSPVDEIDRWVADHPDGCADAMADPFASDAAGS